MPSLNPQEYLGFLKSLREHGLIIIGPKTKLKDGSLSPIYINLRDKMWAVPHLLSKFGNLFATQISGLIPQRQTAQCLICGVPEAANPLATATLLAGQDMGLDFRLVVLRSQPKTHGAGQQSGVIGQYEEGNHLYLIDDVITTSASKREAIDKLVTAGFPTEEITVLVAFNRQQGDLESLAWDGYKTEALFKVLDVARTFEEEGLISPEQHLEIKKFIAENQHQ